MRAAHVHIILLACIFLVGALLRLPHLDRVPPGLWFDEALDGQDAAAVWQPGGHFKFVYPDVFPREAIYTSLLAVAIKLGGPEVISLRLVSVVIGLLTILLLYGMLRQEWGAFPALAGAGILATLRWHVIFSRLVFRTIILGPWLIGITWAALSLRRRPHVAKAVTLGVLLGGGFYTYLTWYFMAPWLLSLVGWLIWHARAGRVPWKHLGLVALAALITFTPLGIHYLNHPEHLFARPQEVSVFKSGFADGLRQIAKNTVDALLMFNIRGDHVPKHNVPLEGGKYGRPALDPIQGIGFLLGLLACLLILLRRSPLSFHLPRALAILLPLWIACALLATIFTVTDSPNFLRTLCAAPAVAALTALGWVTALSFALKRVSSSARAIVFGAILAFSGALTAKAVYVDWPRRMDVWQSFNGDIYDLAQYSRNAPSLSPVYVPQHLLEHRTFQFILLGAPPDRSISIRAYSDFSFLNQSIPSNTSVSQRIVITTAHNQAHGPILDLIPSARVVHEFKAPAGNTYALAIAIPAAGLLSPEAVLNLQNSWRTDLRF